MIAAVRMIALVCCTALAGCGADVTTNPDGSLKQEEGFDFTARTSSASNDLTQSLPRLLRAALTTCGLPNTDIARETLQRSDVYGIYFDRWMDFACPASAKDM